MTSGSILGLQHLQLAMPAGREDAAKRFYGEVLGLEAIEKPPHLRHRGGCWFRLPGAELHLGVENDFRPARKAHPAFLVDRLEEVRRRLERAGAPIVEDTELTGYRRSYTEDPFGNRIELLQATGDAPA
ncbi:MAG TPA: VOC family protein [Thermoanaerobaculia bacterium]|nr:VOC family protein [Thermoanaerobaculia bacterium]